MGGKKNFTDDMIFFPRHPSLIMQLPEWSELMIILRVILVGRFKSEIFSTISAYEEIELAD